MNDATPSAAALRERVLALTHACPKDNYGTHCPFGIMRGLSYESRISVLEQMDVKRLLLLFDLAGECQCPADPRQAPSSS